MPDDAVTIRAVVLDTTVLVGDWSLRSAAATVLVNEARSGRIKLIVPELAIREAAGVFRREFKASQQVLRKAVLGRRRFVVGAPDDALERVDLRVDPDAAAERYVAELRSRLKEVGAEIVGLPDVQHEDVVSRALSHRKPFDDRGRSGYRDTLLWHTVLDVAGGSRRAVLVSANSTDFAESRKSPNQLATELATEVQRLRSEGDTAVEVELCESPAVFIEKYLPDRRLTIELRERIGRDRGFAASIRKKLDRAWIGSYPELDIDADDVPEWTDFGLDLVGDLHDFDVADVSESQSGTALVRFLGHADVQVEFELPAWSALDERGLPVLDDLEWNERTETARYVSVLPAELTFEAVYTPDKRTVDDIELTGIREEWGWVQEGRILGGPVPADGP